jgi:hypothetical protein
MQNTDTVEVSNAEKYMQHKDLNEQRLPACLLFYVVLNFFRSCVSWNLPDEEHSRQH